MDKIPSKLIKISIYYNDPWSEECAKKFNVENNIEIVCQTQQYDSRRTY